MSFSAPEPMRPRLVRMALQPAGSFLTKVKRVPRSRLRRLSRLSRTRRVCVPRRASRSRRGRWSSGGPGDVAAAEFAGEFVEEFDEAGEDEAAEVAHPIVVELAGLQGDEDD